MRTLLMISLLFLGRSLTTAPFLFKIYGSIEVCESPIIQVTQTVYWGVASQTDSSPDVTASQKKFNPYSPPKFIALSRDLIKKYNLDFGDKVYVYGEGWYEFEDVMNKRWTNKVDLLTKPGTMNKAITKIALPPICKTETYEVFRGGFIHP